MNEKKKEKEPGFKKAKIADKNGLNISYDKNELEKFMPNLISEIAKKDKTWKIDSIKYENEQSEKNLTPRSSSSLPNELINPGALDFIRRCTTKDEAFEILDYLLKRGEISIQECEVYKKQISQEGGLQKLISESGGFKKPGYYERKYYKKEYDKLKQKKNKN